jgi:transcriptional regulator with XRE-family HTH domain
MDLKGVLATNLRRLRYERKLTQEDVAELTGLSSRYIGSIERASVSPSVTVLGKLAEAFKVDPCSLITK